VRVSTRKEKIGRHVVSGAQEIRSTTERARVCILKFLENGAITAVAFHCTVLPSDEMPIRWYYILVIAKTATLAGSCGHMRAASAPTTSTHVAAGVIPVPNCGADQGGYWGGIVRTRHVRLGLLPFASGGDGTEQPPFWIIRSPWPPLVGTSLEPQVILTRAHCVWNSAGWNCTRHST
jgi:hypothetical protein